jgi:inhibitor of cysteine peptidase
MEATMFRKSQNLMFVFMLAALILFSTGCGPKAITLTGANNGKAITVNTGEAFLVKLEGNPTTGYTWEAKDLDTQMLEQVGEAAFESSNPSLVGAGGTLTLTFKALKPGVTTLTLVYHRSWETDVPPAETFTLQVTVK